MKSQSYLKGAFIISAGGFISKLLGALYRIPLVAFLGGEGMGIYQMVYPLYCILLTVSASGIPTGIARIISSNQCPFAERPAFRLYGAIGLVGSLIMFALSAPLAKAQGEPAVELCCQILSPEVFFVSVISIVRGYFQGRGNMLPTAATEVAEQAIKVAFGLILCYIFRGDAAVYAGLLYMRSKKSAAPLYFRPADWYKTILKYTVPLTFTAIAMPLSQLIESIAVVAILRGSADNATALWGVFSGCAITLVNLPVSLTYGLAAAGVPCISPLAERGDISAAKSKAARAMLMTLAISLPCAVILFIFSPLAADLIFGSLSAAERSLLVSLVRMMSVNCVTLSLVQTSSACITSLGRPLYGTITQWVTSVARVVLSAALVAFTNLSVSGAAISSNVCYLVAVLLNIWYIMRVRGAKNENNFSGIGNKARRFNAVR